MTSKAIAIFYTKAKSSKKHKSIKVLLKLYLALKKQTLQKISKATSDHFLWNVEAWKKITTPGIRTLDGDGILFSVNFLCNYFLLIVT